MSMLWPQWNLVVPLAATVSVIIVAQLIPIANSTGNETCTLKGSRPLQGVCKPAQDCAAVVSNLRSGISPTLCKVRVRGTLRVCCPTEERISAKKCREYAQLYDRVSNPILLPFLPFSAMRFHKTTPPPKQVHRCSVPATAFIVGGTNANLDEFPFMAALGYKSLGDNNWSCGGTIISEEFVLTAAHCVITNIGKPQRVLVGDIYLKNPNERQRRTIVDVAEVITHPNYKKPRVYNDIALLRLAEKLKLTRSVMPACLPQPELRLENVKSVRAMGWGLVESHKDKPNILQAAYLERNSSTQCNDYYSNTPLKAALHPQGILKTQLCAGDSNGKDTCNGDSGGPLAIKSSVTCLHSVVGITSFGPSLCGLGGPGVYTNVQSYLDWIEDIVWPRF